jgi:hypothetical protein
MSNEITTVEELIMKFLLNLMTERVMSERGASTGVQESLTRVLLASSSTAQAGPSRPVYEKRTKHRDDLTNARLIPSILPTYLSPMSGEINHESLPRKYEQALVTAYLPKGIHTVHTDQDMITALKFSDFNLDNRKVYSMLAPHKYITRTKGKNSKVIPQSWTHNLEQSTLLNSMKIPHFGRHQEMNACVKLLLSCYHGEYLWLNLRITVDPTLINQIIGLCMQGPKPQEFYP